MSIHLDRNAKETFQKKFPGPFRDFRSVLAFLRPSGDLSPGNKDLRSSPTTGEDRPGPWIEVGQKLKQEARLK